MELVAKADARQDDRQPPQRLLADRLQRASQVVRYEADRLQLSQQRVQHGREIAAIGRRRRDQRFGIAANDVGEGDQAKGDDGEGEDKQEPVRQIFADAGTGLQHVLQGDDEEGQEDGDDEGNDEALPDPEEVADQHGERRQVEQPRQVFLLLAFVLFIIDHDLALPPRLAPARTLMRFAGPCHR